MEISERSGERERERDRQREKRDRDREEKGFKEYSPPDLSSRLDRV